VNPTATVQVGTYVSGVITEVRCDFNREVRAGELCARVDPRTYQAAVVQAEAAVAAARAQLRKDEAAAKFALSELERDRGLAPRGALSQSELDAEERAAEQAAAQVDADRAEVRLRESALEAARINLGYTDIRSPVDGTVISRNVDVGQTVAASFQTPTLFLIAKDPSKVQVDTNVSEADIAGARVGARATFRVDAYPGEVFEGRVAQVRRAPISAQNVITYDVVVSADNPGGRLFPGMTATTRIEVESRPDVVSVPSRALRFSPAGASRKSRSPRVYVLRGRRLVAVPVEVGLDDGLRVEIRKGELTIGEPVVVGLAKAASESDDESLRIP
jgi:HlyD family secretion protein